MNLTLLTKKVLTSISSELKEEENLEIIKKDILNPLIKHIFDEIYPYFFKILIIFIFVLIFLVITIFLNLKFIYLN